MGSFIEALQGGARVNERGEVVLVLMLVIMGLSILVNEVRLRRQERWIELAFYDYSCTEMKEKCKEPCNPEAMQHGTPEIPR